MQKPISLKPDLSIANRTAPRIRAAVASLLAHIEHGQTTEVAKRLWPSDRNTGIIAKAASAPATPGWADSFVETVIPDFILNLGPASAAAAVLKHGALQLTYDGTRAFQIPNLTVAAANTSFVRESDPIPARSFGLDSVTLSPRKLATICVFNREIVAYSVPAIEKIVGLALCERAFQAVDRVDQLQAEWQAERRAESFDQRYQREAKRQTHFWPSGSANVLFSSSLKTRKRHRKCRNRKRRGLPSWTMHWKRGCVRSPCRWVKRSPP